MLLGAEEKIENLVRYDLEIKIEKQPNKEVLKLDEKTVQLISTLSDLHKIKIRTLLINNNVNIIDTKTRSGIPLLLSIADLNKFELEVFDRVETPKGGVATVIGVDAKQGSLMFWADGEAGVSFWKNLANANDLRQQNFSKLPVKTHENPSHP